MSMTWFRKAFLAVEQLQALVKDAEADIARYPEPYNILAIYKEIVDRRHYLHDPKTGKPTVSAFDIEWFWSEMKRIYTERGGREEDFPPLVPPITYGPKS